MNFEKCSLHFWSTFLDPSALTECGILGMWVTGATDERFSAKAGLEPKMPVCRWSRVCSLAVGISNPCKFGREECCRTRTFVVRRPNSWHPNGHTNPGFALTFAVLIAVPQDVQLITATVTETSSEHITVTMMKIVESHTTK